MLTEDDLAGQRTASKDMRMPTRRRAGIDPLQLQAGDYVVHEQHGVGRYLEMTSRTIQGATREYLVIEYAPGKRGQPPDRLYVPTDQLDEVTRYVGGEAPSLHRLGGADWAKTKGRARKAVRQIAGELIRLYSARMASPGHAFGPDTPWQRELEDAFPYVETPDQLEAIDEVKRDMERAVPMDRLICGDVGYGKTEIAVRAAFKAVQDGKQVAVLVPTTLLVQQHYATFSERFAPFPVDGRSRCRGSPATPRRPGPGGPARGHGGRGDRHAPAAVAGHPVQGPRAWSSSTRSSGSGSSTRSTSSGCAPRSTCWPCRPRRSRARWRWASPASGRCPRSSPRPRSATRCSPSSGRTTRSRSARPSGASCSATARSSSCTTGSSSINRVAARLGELVPEARVAVAHGQMNEHALEKIMVDFWDREVRRAGLHHDRRVRAWTSRTPTRSSWTAPTRYGLSQLHQLRGRVGRGRERGYAYFLYPPEKPLTETAHERLATIAQHTEIGAGMYVAMKDLEIRGAGNLLGGEQSGHIAGVGFDLYVRMIGEAVSELKGDGPAERPEVRVELPVNAHIPHDYVPGERLRLEAYTRIAAIDSRRRRRPRSATSSTDRYGPPPEPVVNLLDVARLRARARRAGLTDIVQQGTFIRFSPAELPESRQVRVQRLYPKTVLKPATRSMLVPVPRAGSGQAPGQPAPPGAPLLRDTELLTWCGQLIEAVFEPDAPVTPEG